MPRYYRLLLVHVTVRWTCTGQKVGQGPALAKNQTLHPSAGLWFFQSVLTCTASTSAAVFLFRHMRTSTGSSPADASSSCNCSKAATQGAGHTGDVCSSMWMRSQHETAARSQHEAAVSTVNTHLVFLLASSHIVDAHQSGAHYTGRLRT